MKPVEQLENILGRLLHWISSADAKTTPILAITTSMLGVVAALAPKSNEWSSGLVILGLLSTTPLIVSLIALFFVTFPRTEGPEGSMIYFEGIKAKPREDFIRDVLDRDEANYTTDLAEQCHRNAQIASAKFIALRVSMLSLFIAIVPWLVLIWRLYQIKK